MKNNIILFFVLFLISFSAKSQKMKVLSKCLDTEFEDRCLAQLPHSSDFLYLSSWDFRSDENIRIEFPVTLKRNILYVFNLCEGSENNDMVLTILNEDNKMLASNESKESKRKTPMVFFRPTTGGKYYLSTSFDKKSPNCSLIMYGLIRKNVEKYITTK